MFYKIVANFLSFSVKLLVFQHFGSNRVKKVKMSGHSYKSRFWAPPGIYNFREGTFNILFFDFLESLDPKELRNTNILNGIFFLMKLPLWVMCIIMCCIIAPFVHILLFGGGKEGAPCYFSHVHLIFLKCSVFTKWSG